MFNIVDFGKKNVGNILKVAAGLGIAAMGIVGALHSGEPEDDDIEATEEVESEEEVDSGEDSESVAEDAEG